MSNPSTLSRQRKNSLPRSGKLFPTSNPRLQRINDSATFSSASLPHRTSSPSPKNTSPGPARPYDYSRNQSSENMFGMRSADVEVEGVAVGVGTGNFQNPPSPSNRQPTVDSTPPDGISSSPPNKSESSDRDGRTSSGAARRARKELREADGEGRITGSPPIDGESGAPKGQVPKLSSKYRDGDVILLSGDGVLFKVHKTQIFKYAPLLADCSAQARLLNELDLPSNVLPLQEKSLILEILLPFVYHRKSAAGLRSASIPTTDSTLSERSFEELIEACEASQLYGMEKVRFILKGELNSRAKTPLEGLQLYALADRLRDIDWLKSSSRLTLHASLVDYGSEIMPTLSPEACHALWYLHYIRNERCRKIVDIGLSDIPIGDKENNRHNCRSRDGLEAYWVRISRKLLVQAGSSFDPRIIVSDPDYQPEGITCVTCYRCLLNTVEKMEQAWREIPSEVEINYHTASD